jgi:hypothetical protein
MRFSTKAILVVASLALAATASAQPRPGGGGPKPPGGGGGGGGSGGGGAPAGALINSAENEQLAQLFNAANFKSAVVELKNGNHVVKIEFWPGVYSGAYPIFCTEGKDCLGYQIFVNLGGDSGVDQAWLDAWNRSWPYVRAYKLQSGELIFQADVLVRGGVTPQYIQNTASVFKTIVDKSSDFKP